VLWGVACAVAVWARSAWAVALTGAALLHIALDFPFHAEDARMHFWPITDWKFISPISYWDTSQGGAVFGVIEMVLVVALTIYLIARFRGRWWRAVFVALAALQVLPFFAWALFF
ncbi:MAG: cobalamin biosynthesis protein CobQ, partial [Pseudomonadota bacterium]